jgi:hypothetical protein
MLLSLHAGGCYQMADDHAVWSARCMSDLHLHPTRWANCGVEYSPLGWAERASLVEPFLAALGERKLFILSDSIGRDLFMFLASLLLPRLSLPLPNFGDRAYRPLAYPGLNGKPITLAINGSRAAITYKWTPDPLVPFSKQTDFIAKMRRLLRGHDLALFHNGAHAHSSDHQAAGLGGLLTVFHEHPHLRVSLLGYMPTHFPTPDGEHYSSKYLARHGVSACVPHLLTARESFRANWRATTLVDFARNHSLSVLDAWDLAAGAWQDHPHWQNGTDCRHWCVPGPIVRKLVEKLTAELSDDKTRQRKGAR